MEEIKTFYIKADRYLLHEDNVALKQYLDAKGGFISGVESCNKSKVLYIMNLLRTCINSGNIQALFMFLSLDVSMGFVMTHSSLLYTCLRNDDYNTCFLLKSLGCVDSDETNVCCLMEDSSLDTIDLLHLVYRPEDIVDGFLDYIESQVFSHERAMYILNYLTSFMTVDLKYIDVTRHNEAFIVYLLRNGYTDASDMWARSVVRYVLVDRYLRGTGVNLEKSIEVSAKNGAYLCDLFYKGKFIHFYDLEDKIPTTRKQRNKYRRDNHKVANKQNTIRINHMNRGYEKVLRLSRPVLRQPFIHKRIRGFDEEDDPSYIEECFVGLPPEIFYHVLSF